MKISRVIVRLSLLLISVLAVFSACTQTVMKNSALQSTGLKEKDSKTIAVIRNNPDEELLKKVSKLKTFDYDQSSETLLLIPVYNKSTIEIKTLSWDNSELKETGTAYKVENTEDGFGLYVKAIRPEGPPLLKIIVKSPESQSEYLLTYNGKDGTPELEMVNSK